MRWLVEGNMNKEGKQDREKESGEKEVGGRGGGKEGEGHEAATLTVLLHFLFEQVRREAEVVAGRPGSPWSRRDDEREALRQVEAQVMLEANLSEIVMAPPVRLYSGRHGCLYVFSTPGEQDFLTLLRYLASLTRQVVGRQASRCPGREGERGFLRSWHLLRPPPRCYRGRRESKGAARQRWRWR